LIVAYYIAERQSDALDAYRRLKTALSEDLGIEPRPTIRTLHERILRQEVLDIGRAALTAASVAASTLDPADHGDRPGRRGAPSCTVGTRLSPDWGGHPDRPARG
jgi:DNA-binding SARP family transcriptional activator